MQDDEWAVDPCGLFVKEKEDRSEEGPEAHPFKRVAGWNFQEINAFGAKTAGFLYARLLYFHSTHASKRFLGAWNTRKWVKDRGYVEFSGNSATFAIIFRQACHSDLWLAGISNRGY